MSRLRALIMPFVIVPRSSGPSGLPMGGDGLATVTVSPQNSAAGRPTASIFMTATSLAESAPTRLASYSLSSQSVTVALTAPSSTWLFVRI